MNVSASRRKARRQVPVSLAPPPATRSDVANTDFYPLLQRVVTAAMLYAELTAVDPDFASENHTCGDDACNVEDAEAEAEATLAANALQDDIANGIIRLTPHQAELVKPLPFYALLHHLPQLRNHPTCRMLYGALNAIFDERPVDERDRRTRVVVQPRAPEDHDADDVRNIIRDVTTFLELLREMYGVPTQRAFMRLLDVADFDTYAVFRHPGRFDWSSCVCLVDNGDDDDDDYCDIASGLTDYSVVGYTDPGADGNTRSTTYPSCIYPEGYYFRGQFIPAYSMPALMSPQPPMYPPPAVYNDVWLPPPLHYHHLPPPPMAPPMAPLLKL